MQNKILKTVALPLALSLTMLAGCGSKPASGGSGEVSTGGAAAFVEPTPEPLPEYKANVLTGEPLSEDPDYVPERITAVSINNITDARPHRGLSAADMLMEIKVEGGITRFTALYSNYQDIQEVGPIRSGRDQFFQLLLPFKALYIHDGESVVNAQYVRDYDYSEWNINNGAYGYRDLSRVNWQGRTRAGGLRIEHTEYTNSENIAKYIEANEVDMSQDYKSTYFQFSDYRTEDTRPIENGEEAGLVTVTHSASYKSRFIYDPANAKYDMQLYYSTDKTWRDEIDEANGQQLEFTNLVVLYTDIHTYPGHEAKDLQDVVYNYGGYGFYFYGGQMQRIYWEKPAPLEALKLYTLGADNKRTDEMVVLNRGKTYLAVVDLDEFEKGFSWGSADGQDLSSGSFATSANSSLKPEATEVELGEDDGAPAAAAAPTPTPAAEATAAPTPTPEVTEATPAPTEAPTPEPTPEATQEPTPTPETTPAPTEASSEAASAAAG